jgi:hypothetical protein
LLKVVILRDGEPVKVVERPARDKPVAVAGVELVPGRNELTAVLAGPGGYGPESAPIVVHQDRDAPELRITAPESGSETFEDAVEVVISSEPGASLKVANGATKRDNEYTVGPAGSLKASVPLAMGRNRITVTSTDEAGMRQDETVVVFRRDGRPVIGLNATPKQVRRADLPHRLRVVVVVKDSTGNEIEGAEVSFTLGGPGWQTQDSVDTTNASGRATWTPELEASAAQVDPKVTVEVVAPNRERGEAFKEIQIT